MVSSRYSGVVGEYSKPVPHFSVYNFRSEKKIKYARKSDGNGCFPDCDTDDEFEMAGRAKKKGDRQHHSQSFYEHVRDYMISYVTRSPEVLLYLRDNMSRFSVPVQGGRTYYRGKKINPKTLDAMLNQKMKDPSNEAFTHGLMHGFRTQDNPSPEHKGIPFHYKGQDYTHHGVSSISSMYYTGKRYGLKRSEPAGVRAEGDIPLLLELETTKEKPFHAVIPKYNYYPSKFLKHHPSSEHEMMPDPDKNTYRLSKVIYDPDLKLWIAKIWASAEPPQQPIQQAPQPKHQTPQPSAASNPFSHQPASPQQDPYLKGPITINPKTTSNADKLASWQKIYEMLKDSPDFMLSMNTNGQVLVYTKPPRHSFRKSNDADQNELVDIARDSNAHIPRYSRKPFVVVRDLLHDPDHKKPHLLILPSPVRKGNYQDLRQFLQYAPDNQKIALWDCMAALINSTSNMPQTETLFKTNGGHRQSIPYFSIHYMPFIKD